MPCVDATLSGTYSQGQVHPGGAKEAACISNSARTAIRLDDFMHEVNAVLLFAPPIGSGPHTQYPISERAQYLSSRRRGAKSAAQPSQTTPAARLLLPGP